MADFVYTYNGLTFGAGTLVHVIRAGGLTGLDVDLLNVPLARWHGGVPASSYMTSREIVLDLEVEGTTDADLATRLDQVLIAFAPSVDIELPLLWTHPGQAQRRVDARVRAVSEVAPLDQSSVVGRAIALTVRLEAADPVVYSGAEGNTLVTPYVINNGAVYSIAYAKNYTGAGIVPVSVTNAGLYPSWPRLEIHGPTEGVLTNPVITNVTTGKTLALTGDGGAAVAAGQVLVVETNPTRRSIAFTTGQSRYGKVSVDSEFWALEPGANEIRFYASGDTVDAYCTVISRDAWLRG